MLPVSLVLCNLRLTSKILGTLVVVVHFDFIRYIHIVGYSNAGYHVTGHLKRYSNGGLNTGLLAKW